VKRQIGKYWRPFAAILGLILIAGAVSAYILTNQRLRFPFISDQPVRMYAEMENAQAVTPGQGQTVQIAGVKIGDIGELKLRNGRALVALDIEPKYKDYIHTDARASLRPRTGLKDMYVQVYPGSNDAPLAKKNFTIPIGRTTTDVDLDEILQSFDADTRDYLQLFINGAGKGLKGRGQDLAEVFRRFEPTFRDLARVQKAVAQEKAALRTTINSLAKVTSQLNKRPQELTGLVDASAATFEAFASEDQNLRSTVRQLPGTLEQATQTLAEVQPFADQLGPTARKLIPVFNALERANASTRTLGREATPIVRDQIRPFVRQSRPLVRDLRPAAQGLNRTFPDLVRTVKVLNTFFNLLGYNDKGREGPAVKDRDEGYLFWLAWTSHQATNLINIDDANGPMRPIFLTGTCTTLVKLVQDRPELEFGMALSPLLANLCNNPSTSSINLPLQRKMTRAAEKARDDG
jgi:phospholipid/cholesterol/gamma-HCH transport system substrate-binding protein